MRDAFLSAPLERQLIVRFGRCIALVYLFARPRPKMKQVVAVALVLCSLLSVQPTLGAQCTPVQMEEIKTAQQDPAILSACASVVIDTNKPVTLPNLDFCKSDECLNALKNTIGALPDCERNGMSVATGSAMLLNSCSTGVRPPPPPPRGGSGNGPMPPPPPGPNGPPSPPGPNGPPGESTTSKPPTTTTAPSTTASDGDEPTVKPAEEDETDAPSPSKLDEPTEYTDDGGSSASGSTSIETPEDSVGGSESESTSDVPKPATGNAIKSTVSVACVSAVLAAAAWLLA